jgi:penicillin amidase
VLALTLWLRHAERRALPQLDGTLHVEGLTQDVTVARNAQGVPTIHAANLDDLLFAQGYVTAQDRLWQMDMLRRHAAGELAELLGPSLVAHDRMQRYLQLNEAADRSLQTMPADQLHQLQAYAHGVNAFIEAHPDSLPLEFHVLHYSPRPWSPRDSLLVGLVLSEELSNSFPQKLNREELVQHLPAALVPDLYPVGSWRDEPPTQTPLDLSAPTDHIEEIPLDRSQSRVTAPMLATPHDLLAVFHAVRPADCSSCRAGSNNWAVSGARTATGAPMLANDMHLGLTAPDIWYEAVLQADTTPAHRELLVEGVTLPGVPFVIAGRNQQVAWGFTNTGSDVQDVRIEHVRGSGDALEYERPGGAWAFVQHDRQTIHVRGGRDVQLDVMSTAFDMGVETMQTPIISPLYPSDHRTLSLAWNIYSAHGVTLPFFEVNSASDAASLVAAFVDFAAPSLNLVYADAQHIGFHVIGRVPVRGPALQHPRILQSYLLLDTQPETDEEDETGDTLSQHSPAASPVDPGLDGASSTTPPVDTNPTSMSFTIGSPIADIPVDALDQSQVWSGFIPYNQLPAVLDPSDGILATANARVTTDTYPYAITNDWVDAYRVERIHHLLQRTGLTSQDMLHIETDVHSDFDLLLAQRTAYAIDHASPALLKRDARLHQAADLLRRWNGDMQADSAAAAIVSQLHQALWPALLTAQIQRHDALHTSRRRANADAMQLTALYTWEEKTSALELLLLHQPARWLPSQFGNWHDFLASTLLDVLHQNHAPGDLRQWQYGKVHPVEINHPLLGSNPMVQAALGTPTGTGTQPNSGDGTTVKQTGRSFGPSERLIIDMSQPEHTLLNITTGESGQPGSPYYLDQFHHWLTGNSYALPLHTTAVQHTLILTAHKQ